MIILTVHLALLGFGFFMSILLLLAIFRGTPQTLKVSLLSTPKKCNNRIRIGKVIFVSVLREFHELIMVNSVTVDAPYPQHHEHI